MSQVKAIGRGAGQWGLGSPHCPAPLLARAEGAKTQRQESTLCFLEYKVQGRKHGRPTHSGGL